MLRWMCGHVKSDKVIQIKVRVTSMMDKLKEVRLRCFEYVKRRCVDSAEVDIEGRRKGKVDQTKR